MRERERGREGGREGGVVCAWVCSCSPPSFLPLTAALFTSLFASSSVFTASACPFHAAMSSGVHPPFCSVTLRQRPPPASSPHCHPPTHSQSTRLYQTRRGRKSFISFPKSFREGGADIVLGCEMQLGRGTSASTIVCVCVCVCMCVCVCVK